MGGISLGGSAMLFRQDAILGSLFLSAITGKGFFMDQNPCDGSFPDEDYFVFGNTWLPSNHTGNDTTGGIPYMTCWQNDTQTTGYNQTDVDVIDCLIDLHSKQGDSCITVSGSACDKGYIDGGGRVASVRIPSIFEKGENNPDLQINTNQSMAIQAGFNELLKVTSLVRGASTRGPYTFMANVTTGMPDQDQQISTWSQPGIQINWVGESNAGC